MSTLAKEFDLLMEDNMKAIQSKVSSNQLSEIDAEILISKIKQCQLMYGAGNYFIYQDDDMEWVCSFY